MLAEPLATLGEGVKLAVLRLEPVRSLKPVMVPLLTTMSLTSKPVGGSLDVKVMVAVSSTLRAALSLVIASVGATVGAKVSSVMLGVVPAPPLLPAASV